MCEKKKLGLNIKSINVKYIETECGLAHFFVLDSVRSFVPDSVRSAAQLSANLGLALRNLFEGRSFSSSALNFDSNLASSLISLLLLSAEKN